MRATAECTWGEGPDVLIVVETVGDGPADYGVVAYDHGAGSFGLSVEEAIRLQHSLGAAIADVKAAASNVARRRPISERVKAWFSKKG